MLNKNVLERYLDALLNGDRSQCRTVIEEALQSGVPANSVYMDVIWPVMVEIDGLYRKDIIDSAQEAFATRINRTIVDQLQNKLPRKPKVSKRVVICSESSEQGELGGQMMADLFESSGWDVRFLGGTVSDDDIMGFVHSFKPDALLLYGINAQRAPQTRRLIDTIKKVNAFPEMRILVSGGIFDRADGLWEEIGADCYAATASEAVRVASCNESELKQPERTINQRKKQATGRKHVKASA
ncbi:MAG: B12-binding domain-containing protein [Anaerohalosphaera sp.]|nr:B12-binding domain-containing protein [Anaerohalosphaera sp.]